MAGILQKIIALLCNIKLGGVEAPQELASLDIGVLKIAVMMAALDGEILPGEYAAFGAVYKACRGYGSCSTDAMFDKLVKGAECFLDKTAEAFRSPEERLAAFKKESLKALPKGFSSGSMADLRRAFALWQVMAMSDGTVSDLEQAAMKLLLVEFARVPGSGVPQGAETAEADITMLLENDFLSKVEAAVSGLANPATRATKQEELVTLVTTITVQDGSRRRQHQAYRVLVSTIMQIAVAMSAIEGRVL